MLPKGFRTLAVLAVLGGTGWAGDWPQILGPHRNGIADGEQLHAWDSKGPARAWSKRLGAGYAGPAIVGDHVVVFHRVDDQERVEAFSTTDGKSVWQADFTASYRGGINPDTGPRCVPLIHGGNVFVFGAAGDVHCVSLATGKPRWSRRAYQDYKADEGYFGAGSTPIIADKKLLVNVGGGRQSAGLVAFELDTGKTAWAATEESASYSSPTKTTVDGQETVIFVTRLNAVAVDPATGRIRFRFPFGKRGPTVNAATPLVFGNHLFVSASYGVGAELAKLSASGAERVWSNDESLSSQYTTGVYHSGFLYGTHGREDVGDAAFRCVDAKTGAVKWSEESFGVAHVILAGDKLLILRTDGELVLADASPRQFRRLASHEIATTKMRAIPALSNGRLYCRTNATDHAGELHCLIVGNTP